MRISRKDAKKLNLPVPTKRHKYNARRTTVDGITFASAKEAKRYSELKLLEKADQIRYLELQPRFDLHVNGILIGSYFADFGYLERVIGNQTIWVKTVEDTKGMRTPLYKWKRKHAEVEHGITIRET